MRRILSVAVATAFAAAAAPSPPTWVWPVDEPRVVRPFVAPAHAYGPGHRGIDIAGRGAVRAPDDGVIAFAGRVVDRDVLTIDHGDGIVSSFEPVETDLAPGTRVAAGDAVGQVAAGGHVGPGSLHLGARVDGAYVNPLLFLGGIPRAVLLPCC